MQNTTVKTGKGWNWLSGNKPPGGVVGPFGLPGESLQVLTGSACGTAETPDSG